VFSAKAGITKLLDKIASLGGNDLHTRNLHPLLLKFYDEHGQLAAGLSISSEGEILRILNEYHKKIGELARNIFMNKTERHASILQMGELVSSEIISIYLSSIGVDHLLFDARDYLVADSRGCVKKVLDFPEHFTKKKILITQGFISRDENGRNTILSFMGSNLTLAHFAVKLKKPFIPLEVTFHENKMKFDNYIVSSQVVGVLKKGIENKSEVKINVKPYDLSNKGITLNCLS
jgi:aspartokinase